MLTPGQYYIGDLCYVFNRKTWDEVLTHTIDGDTTKDGQFELKDGRTFCMYSTYYGDGEYEDDQGRTYMVDSGSIGLVLASDIDTDKEVYGTNGGQLVHIDRMFGHGSENGCIYFGDISIDTKGDGEYAYDDEDTLFDED